MTDVLIEKETIVEVAGTVRRLSLGELQEDYAVPCDEGIFEKYAGDAMIIADRLLASTHD